MDGVTAAAYAEHLDENRRAVPERRRSGRYQAAPVARVGSAQEAGSQRPSGQPAFAAKMVPRAVAMRRDASDEPAFLDGSSGVRPGRSPHEALHA
jgi:RNA-directed DNA polymerase